MNALQIIQLIAQLLPGIVTITEDIVTAIANLEKANASGTQAEQAVATKALLAKLAQ